MNLKFLLTDMGGCSAQLAGIYESSSIFSFSAITYVTYVSYHPCLQARKYEIVFSW